MNTFYLYALGGEKQLAKKGSVWEFAANGSKIGVGSSDMVEAGWKDGVASGMRAEI